jgi:putative ABC transport system permease protein
MWRRGRALRHLDDDIREHLERETADNIARGMSPPEARRQALLTFGNPALVRENTRAVWIVRWLETLRQDVRSSLRILVKHPGVTTAAILSLAVGIGANTAVFSVVNRILLQPLPYEEPDRLVMISAVPSAQPDQRSSATIPEYIVWERHAGTFEGLATAFQQPMTLGADDSGSPAEMVLVEKVRSSLFRVLGVRPAIGRAFRADEEQVDAPAPVVLLSDEFWATRYDRDRDVLGRAIRLNGVPTTIIGVMPPDFSFLRNGKAQLYAPLSWNTPQLRGTARVFPVVARLEPGVTIAQAQADMDAVVKQVEPELPAPSKGWVARVAPLHEAMVSNLRPTFVLLQGAVGFVLLIACANVAGLLLARAATRRTEMAVRAAIGAGRSRIVRQLLTESVVLAIAGGLAGVVVGWLLLRLLVTMSASFVPTLPDVEIDAPVLVFTLAASILTGIAVGVLPALGASRPDLVDALKSSGRGAVAVFAGQRVRRTIVVAQIALSFVLLIGAGLTLRSLVRLETRDLGGDPEGVLRVNIPFTGMFRQVGSAGGYPVAEAVGDVTGTIDRILGRLQSIPGVQAVAGASLPPYVSSGPEIGFSAEGQVARANDGAGSLLNAAYHVVTPAFFATMRIPMERGREFDDRDTAAGPWGLVINAAMARRFWPGENPLGQRVLIDMTADERPREIIGIVSDYRSSPYELDTEPAMFALYRQQPAQTRSPAGMIMRNRMNFVLRTSADPASIAGPVRTAMAEIDPDRPISDIQSVEQYLGLVLAPSRYASVVFGVFAGIALLLAAVGTYGVMSHGVGQRTREIGIRMALGARGLDVLRLVMGQVLLIAAVGVALGLGGAALLTRLMPDVVAGLTWGIQPTDILTYVSVSAVLTLVACLAGWIPTRRAIRIAPTVALRCE